MLVVAKSIDYVFNVFTEEQILKNDYSFFNAVNFDQTASSTVVNVSGVHAFLAS
jgi:hypothetical protein